VIAEVQHVGHRVPVYHFSHDLVPTTELDYLLVALLVEHLDNVLYSVLHVVH